MGSPVVHFELISKDPANVSDFYAKIFGWKIQHMSGPVDYRLVETGGEGGINGGILKPEREGPWPGNMLFYNPGVTPSPAPGVQGVWANGERIADANGMLPLERLPGRFLRGFSA